MMVVIALKDGMQSMVFSAEAIWRILNKLTSPVGVGLYIEPTVGKLQDSLEAKLI